MPSLTDLPAEIRQNILALALPDWNQIDQPWPQPVRNLLHASQRIRKDTQQIMGLWSSIHIVPTPQHMAALEPQNSRSECNPKLERLCLNLFHQSDPERIRWCCYCSANPADWSHPEIIQAWLEAVQQLPPGISAVHLDVTPAPDWTRSKPRYIIDPLIHDRRAAKRFLGEHISDISNLIKAIDRQCKGAVPIRLTGKLSTRSTVFLERVTAECAAAGIDIDFIGERITAEMARVAKISTVVEKIAPTQKAMQARRKGEQYKLQPFRDVEWSEKAKNLFKEIGDAGEEEEAVEDLRALAEFMVDDSVAVLNTASAPNLRRALIHCAAQTMGFRTESKGEGKDRYVMVLKSQNKP